jgi:hypothetical protein
MCIPLSFESPDAIANRAYVFFNGFDPLALPLNALGQVHLGALHAAKLPKQKAAIRYSEQRDRRDDCPPFRRHGRPQNVE